MEISVELCKKPYYSGIPFLDVPKESTTYCRYSYTSLVIASLFTIVRKGYQSRHPSVDE